MKKGSETQEEGSVVDLGVEMGPGQVTREWDTEHRAPSAGEVVAEATGSRDLGWEQRLAQWRFLPTCSGQWFVSSHQQDKKT